MGVIDRQRIPDEERETSGNETEAEKIARRRYRFLTQLENDIGLGRAWRLQENWFAILQVRSVKKSHKCSPISRYNGGKGPLTTNTERRSWIE